MTMLMHNIFIKKDTYKKMQKFCKQGETHDNFVNRLIDVCEKEDKIVNLDSDTEKRLMLFAGTSNIDEAINLLMERFNYLYFKKN